MRSLDLSCPRLSGANISDLAEQASASGIWEIDLVTDTVRGTSQFFRNMGLQPTEQPVPMTLLRSLRPSDDRQRIDRGYVETVAQGADLYESEYRIHRANDGAERWILGRGKVTRDARGVPISYSGVDIDITDRKRAELALADSEARLKLAVIAGNIGIWDWNLATGEMTYPGCLQWPHAPSTRKYGKEPHTNTASFALTAWSAGCRHMEKQPLQRWRELIAQPDIPVQFRT
jgi:PAS domain S-box-containing protein